MTLLEELHLRVEPDHLALQVDIEALLRHDRRGRIERDSDLYLLDAGRRLEGRQQERVVCHGQVHLRGHQGVGEHHPVGAHLDTLHSQEQRLEATRVHALQPELKAPLRGAARIGARIAAGTATRAGAGIAAALHGAPFQALRFRPVPTAAADRANTGGNERLHHPPVHRSPPYTSPWSLSWSLS